jgi:hypothetical protein
METNSLYIELFYGFIAIFILAGSFWVTPKVKGWLFYVIVIILFSIGGLIVYSYLLAIAGFMALIVIAFRMHQHFWKNKKIKVVLVQDHDDHYLQYFLEYYKTDISKYFPAFDFKIEEEYLVALLLSEMETVGLIIAEIKNAETLRICVDYLIPKHRKSYLAVTLYQCELNCINFLGYRYLYIEPQSKAHNDYLEKIGFRLIDGKYVNQYLGK